MSTTSSPLAHTLEHQNVSMSITDFCDQHNILWFPVYLELVPDKDGKMVKELRKIEHESYKGVTKEGHLSYKPHQSDFNKLREEQVKNRQKVLKLPHFKHIRHIAMDTRKVYHVDIDVPDYDPYYKELMEKTPYFESTSKSYGRHILITSNNMIDKKRGDQLVNNVEGKGQVAGVELLCGQWSYAPIEGVIYNADKPIIQISEFTSRIYKTNEKEKSQKKIKKTAVPHVDTPENMEVSNELKEYGDNIDIQYLDNYNNWTSIIWSLKSHDENLKEFARYLSQKSRKYDESCFNDKWKEYNLNNSKMTIGTFHHYSKISNEKNYLQIRIKYHPTSINNAIKYRTSEIITECFSELFKHEYIFFQGSIYHFNGVYWIQDKNKTTVRRKFTKEFTNIFVEKKIDASNQLKGIDADSEEYKSKQSWINNIDTLIKALQSNKMIKDCCNDSIIPYIEKIDMDFERNPYAFVFNNKVYDLKNMCWMDVPNREDFMVLSTGYDYREPTEDEITKMRQLIIDILPIEEERTLYMVLLATGMYGMTVENFTIANGSGRNGKGFINESATETLGNYAYTLGCSTLMKPIGDGANQTVANMEYKRLILSREPDSSSYNKLNVATIKELTGGDHVNSRGMYSSKTKTILCGTHIMECNTKPKMSGEQIDNAIMMRLIDVPFRTTFVKDHSLVCPEENRLLGDNEVKTKEFKNTHKFALFHILLEYWKLYVEKDMNIVSFIPQHIKDRVTEYLTDSNVVLSWFKDEFEFSGDEHDVIQVADIFDEFKKSDTYLNMMSKAEKRATTKKMMVELFETNPLTYKYYRARETRTKILTKYGVTQIRNCILGFKCKKWESLNDCHEETCQLSDN